MYAIEVHPNQIGRGGINWMPYKKTDQNNLFRPLRSMGMKFSRFRIDVGEPYE